VTTPLRIAVVSSGLGDSARGIETWVVAEFGEGSILRQYLAYSADVMADRP
jgi:hypothetical protein